MAKATYAQIPALLAGRKPFEGNTMWATDKHFYGSGRLSTAENEKYSREYPNLVYVVYSYGTPIAWVLKDGTKHIVQQRFSVTTSKHQGKLYAL